MDSKQADAKLQVFATPKIYTGTTRDGMLWVLVEQGAFVELRCNSVHLEFIKVQYSDTVREVLPELTYPEIVKCIEDLIYC